MAAIPASNIGTRQFCTLGNLRCEFFNVTGDGTGTTLQTRLGKVLGMFTGNQTETAGYSPQLSASGNTVTYGAAPTNTKIHTLFIVGTD